MPAARRPAPVIMPTRVCATDGCERLSGHRRHCPLCDVRLERGKWRAGKDRLRPAKARGDYEKIDRTKVFERDGWRCGICCGTIDPQLSHPHQMCGSIDHVIPLSRGGSHTYANVQAAHLRCNSIKSDGD